ncbi:LLM class flavin-dependent oxidoreductase [Streptomyces sp. MS19]|uniref:LLM class flavin-dependent oxidoreductase n=1 Tax=Streptomyces sp. MS19 TaxID=3385972 RepID=UPI00399FDB7F
MAQRRRLGVMYDRDLPPEGLADLARTVEESGADDLWVVEDLAWAGAVSSAAVALAATSRLRVGIGIMPAPLRNPVLLAMEIATLARAFPGRLIAGLGHGVRDWMAQVGAAPASPLSLLGETLEVTRTLLAGGTATLNGREVRVDGVRLVHPPAEPPPLVTGVLGPRSLELSGRLADGTIMAEGQGPGRIATALGHIGRGRAAHGRPHELIVFTHLFTRDDPAAVRAATAPVIAESQAFLGVPRSEVHLAAGDTATALERVGVLWEAGADTVVLRPIGPDPLSHLRPVLTAARR